MCVYSCDLLYLSICVCMCVIWFDIQSCDSESTFMHSILAFYACAWVCTCAGALYACILGTKTGQGQFVMHILWVFLIFQLEELFRIQSLLICNWATTEHCKPDRRLLSRAWRTDWMWAWREWLMCDFKQDQALEKDDGWFGHSRVPGVCCV